MSDTKVIAKTGDLSRETTFVVHNEGVKGDALREIAAEAYFQGLDNRHVIKKLVSEHNLPYPNAKKIATETVRRIHEEYKQLLQQAAQTNWLRLENLYEEARNNNDRKMMLEVIREENRILGVYQEAPTIEQRFEIVIQ